MSISAESCRVSLGYWLDRVAAGEDVVVTRRGKPMVRLTAAALAVQSPAAAQAAAEVQSPAAAPALPPPLALAPPLLFPPAGEAESA